MGCVGSKDVTPPPVVTQKENKAHSAPSQPPTASNNNNTKSAAATTTTGPADAAAGPSAGGPKAKKGPSFGDKYKLGKELGSGAFSVVKQASNRTSGEIYAVKIVTKAKLTEEDEIALKDEIMILKELQHNHIIRLYDVFDEEDYYFLCTEVMKGGELFDRVVQKSYYNEKEARDVCVILFDAIGYCHEKKVAHRDLKPENLLLLSATDDSTVKIADFGFAKKCPNPNMLTTQCGTPGYVAPEILEGTPYDVRADMWSLGVIAYILLGGYPPFIENEQRELFRKIRRGQYEFHEEYWGQVSTDAKALISGLLTVDVSKRLTAAGALKHKWTVTDDEKLLTVDLGVNLAAFKKYNAKRKFKAAARAVMVTQKLTSLGMNLKKDLE